MRAPITASLLLLASLATGADPLLPWSDFKPTPETRPETWTYASAKRIAVVDAEGVQAVRLNALEDSLVIATCDRPLPPGTRTLILKGRLRSSDLMAGALPSQVGRAALQIFANGKRVVDQIETISGTTSWRKFTLTAECPPGAERFQVHFGTLKAKSGTLLVTDLELTVKP